MYEQEIEQTPSSIEDLFNGDTIVRFQLKGCPVRFYYKEKDSDTDLGYQQRLSAINSQNGKVRASDKALLCDIWLFDQLCHKAEAKIGENWEEVPDFKHKVSSDVKRQANFLYNRRIQPDTDDAKN